MIYTLMHKKIPVASLELDGNNAISRIRKIYQNGHLPPGTFHKDGNLIKDRLNRWWTGRGIPASRSGLREALSILKINETFELLDKGFGLSLSDQYWIKPEESALEWEKINYFQNDFSEDVGTALFGRGKETGRLNLMSPDNTSDGWLKKRWAIIEGRRMLVKAGSPILYQEPVNEVLAAEIMERLGIDHVPYKLYFEDNKPHSICETFITPQTELISAWSLYNTVEKPVETSDYDHFLICCRKQGIQGAADFLDRMLVVDYIIENTDRHYHNFGAVRDADTLEWLGMSPVYDSGTSLWHNVPTMDINIDYEGDSKPFEQYHSRQIKLVKNHDWLDLSRLAGVGERFEELLLENRYIDEKRRGVLCKGLQRRIEILERVLTDRSLKNRSSPTDDYDYNR